MSKKLTRAELKLISELLLEVSDQYSNHGCNDYEIENTKANKALLIKMIKSDIIDFGGYEYQEEEIEEVKSCKKKMLFTHDCSLMAYLADRCKEAAE